MIKITINPADRCFMKGNEPFFYLADTAWCAFQHISADEFRRYARKRAEQGFTAVQISALPLSFNTGDWHPFEKVGDSYDYSRINTDYFDHATELLKIALEAGLMPCIHLLWVEYVPDTWGCSRPIPEEYLEPILSYMIERFAPYTPFFSVSGDTRFETSRVVRYYKTALDLIKAIAPDALTTLHINPECFPPRELTDHPAYSFASYQSGHGDGDWLSKIDGFSEAFGRKLPGYPLVNTEPCYEDIGHYLNKSLRFKAADIRHAAWRSILGGASAGIAYGAHGVWQCRLPEYPMFGEETWGKSADIFSALEFPGASSICEMKRIFTSERLWGLKPSECCQEYISAVSEYAGKARTVTYYPDITGVHIPEGAKLYRFGKDALVIH